MAIAGNILEGAATLAASGGTAVTLASLGIVNGVNTFNFSTDTSNITRRLLKASVSLSNINENSPGGRTLQRNKLRITFPKTLASTEVSEDYFEITSGTHPESTSAEVETRMEQTGQFLIASTMLGFWFSGNLG